MQFNLYVSLEYEYKKPMSMLLRNEHEGKFVLGRREGGVNIELLIQHSKLKQYFISRCLLKNIAGK